MENELKITYRLYALEATADNIRSVKETRFCRITPYYILVYTDGEPPKDGIEMTQSNTHRLSEHDEQWLSDCNIVIIAEQAKKHEAEIAADMAKRLERLEAALKAEKEKQQEVVEDGRESDGRTE